MASPPATTGGGGAEAPSRPSVPSIRDLAATIAKLQHATARDADRTPPAPSSPSPPSAPSAMSLSFSGSPSYATRDSFGAPGASTPFDTSRRVRTRTPKENQMLIKNGRRHHAYPPEKAPYPLSYDSDYLDLEALNRLFVANLFGSVSLLDFKGNPPKRVLDLACGRGVWILEAAKVWTECQFVGFDLVNVQLPLQYVDPSVAARITWVHGNFLSNRLPFDDDDFELVRMSMVSRGIPESKWNSLFEEVHRVLEPGGGVEIIEDDMIFPVLPRWFTAPLHDRTRPHSFHLPEGSNWQSFSSSGTDAEATTEEKALPSHEHALLEKLFYSVFDNRFINMNPTGNITIYFSAYFKNVYAAPIIHFPWPPFHPPPRPPALLSPTTPHASGSDSLGPPSSSPTAAVSGGSSPLGGGGSPASSLFTTASEGSSTIPSSDPPSSDQASESSSVVPTVCEAPAVPGAPAMPEVPAVPPTPVRNRLSRQGRAPAPEPPLGHVLPSELLSTIGVDGGLATEYFELGEHALVIHLYRAFQEVLACQETMWEELNDWRRNQQGLLRNFGWDDEEFEESLCRQKFERMVERYRSDMQIRLSLSDVVANLGWKTPNNLRDPMSRAEKIGEDRVYRAFEAAYRASITEEETAPCRTVRAFLGYKAITD